MGARERIGALRELKTGGMCCGRQMSQRVLTDESTRLRANFDLEPSRHSLGRVGGCWACCRATSVSQRGAGDSDTDVAGVYK